MVSRHIKRDFSAHKKSIYRPYDEYTGLEIYSFDPKYTQTYLVGANQVNVIANAVKTNWKAWRCLKATPSTDTPDMELSVKYNVKEAGEYRIDFLYEQSNHIYTIEDMEDYKKYNTSKDLLGHIKVTGNGGVVQLDEDVRFGGENNAIKRKYFYKQLKKGSHRIEITAPFNVYFYGVIVRKVKKYTGNNYFGEHSGKDQGELVFTNATLTVSDMVKPSELSLTVLYNDAFECYDSPSGFYIDYMDEVNFYVKDNDGEIRRVFGGYVSSILPNDARTELSIHCADRLVDGQNKYILDDMKLNGGTKPKEDLEYEAGMSRNFKTYAHALKYLCDIHEVTLKSNIPKDFLVDGEKFSKGFTITYGKKKSIKKIPVTNGYSTPSDNYITIRNKPSGEKKQVWTLYDAKEHSSLPINITDYGYMHLTYGLGGTKKEYEKKITETTDVSDTTAGAVKFGKCGVSSDKKYVMAIGTTSSAKDKGKYGTYYKTVFENKCPHCGGRTLRWDSCRSDTKCIYTGRWNGSKGSWGVSSKETEITCTKCDSDYSALGNEKDSPWKKLKKISSTKQSSKAEQDKLHKGKMSAVPKTGVAIKPDNIFEAITTLAKQYKYKRGGSSTWSGMKKTGSGDCHAFSQMILDQFKHYKVQAKISEYDSGVSTVHQSVLYKDVNGKFVDFPYKKYGWNKMLYATSGSKNGRIVAENKDGSSIGNVTVSSTSTSKKQTYTLKTIKGYDKDNPFQGYLKIVYSTTPTFNKHKKKTLYIKFTHDITSDYSINTGFPLYWVNNTVKQSSLNIDIVDFIRNAHHNEDEKIYLHSIHMITPPKKPDEKSENTDWYTYDKQTHDEASCKLDLYQITFNDDDRNNNSAELSSCGKTINSMMDDIVKDTGYLVNMTYGNHRKDDIINFRVNNPSGAVFKATEGDDNNILSWNSINYSPLSSLYNMSIQVYKKEDGDYHYVDSRNPISVLNYQEQCTLETSNNMLSDTEAYWNARMNEKYNSEQTYTYTITVPNYPNIRLGELVQVVANVKKLNTIKEVKSIKITFDKGKMPRIQTELGLDELAPNIQLTKNIRQLRSNAKKTSTSFSSSAIPCNRSEIFEWEG